MAENTTKIGMTIVGRRLYPKYYCQKAVSSPIIGWFGIKGIRNNHLKRSFLFGEPWLWVDQSQVSSSCPLERFLQELKSLYPGKDILTMSCQTIHSLLWYHEQEFFDHLIFLAVQVFHASQLLRDDDHSKIEFEFQHQIHKGNVQDKLFCAMFQSRFVALFQTDLSQPFKIN